MQDYGWRFLSAVESHSERNAALLAGGLVWGLVREILQQWHAVHGKMHRLWRRSCQTKHMNMIHLAFKPYISASCKENSIYSSWIIWWNDLYFSKWIEYNDSVWCLVHVIHSAVLLTGHLSGELHLQLLLAGGQSTDVLLLTPDEVRGQPLSRQQKTGQNRQSGHLQCLSIGAPAGDTTEQTSETCCSSGACVGVDYL